jgi:hypothetical protein
VAGLHIFRQAQDRLSIPKGYFKLYDEMEIEGISDLKYHPLSSADSGLRRDRYFKEKGFQITEWDV